MKMAIGEGAVVENATVPQNGNERTESDITYKW
jgi:hypothetical protein